eukprot:1377157-Amorphochlora_amoeboformis.AAC.1
MDTSTMQAIQNRGLPVIGYVISGSTLKFAREHSKLLPQENIQTQAQPPPPPPPLPPRPQQPP